MPSLVVGVFHDHEIFAAGVQLVLEQDAGVDDVVSDRADVDRVDVFVASIATVESLDGPTVLCVAEQDVRFCMPDRPEVHAVLSRRTATPARLCAAVHAVAAGLRIQDDQLSTASLDGRSLQVLGLLAEGAGTREISNDLGYSERTIKSVIQSIEMRLGARTRAQAVALALRGSLI